MSGTRAEWKEFSKGVARLHAARTGIGENAGTYEDIKAAYKEMSGLWGQAHHIRAFGSFLLDVFCMNGEVEGDVERVFTIDYTDGKGRAQTMSVGTPAPDMDWSR